MTKGVLTCLKSVALQRSYRGLNSVKFPHIHCNQGGGGHDSNSAWYLFRVPMIHRFMTSHPVAKLLLCFGAKHQDGRPMLFGFFVILTNRLTELCILNAENVEKVSSRPFKQIS